MTPDAAATAAGHDGEGPWMPAGLRKHIARLTVGTRVRVRLNGECDFVVNAECCDCKADVGAWPHEASTNGRVAVIVSVISGFGAHTTVVRFNVPAPLYAVDCACGAPQSSLTEDLFAAVELVLLEDAPEPS